jgi:hypothetical protein
MSELSLPRSDSSDPSSRLSNSSNITTATSVDSVPVDGWENKPATILSQISSPDFIFPKYDTPPSKAEVSAFYPWEMIEPSSTIYDRTPVIPRTPSNAKYQWGLSTTLYTDPLNGNKLGPPLTSLGHLTTHEDTSASRRMSALVDDAASGMGARFSRLANDLVDTMNINTPSGRGCRSHVAVTAFFTQLYSPLAGEHTVYEAGNLANTIEAEGYKYIDDWRAELQAAGGNVLPRDEIIRPNTLHWVQKPQGDVHP